MIKFSDDENYYKWPQLSMTQLSTYRNNLHTSLSFFPIEGSRIILNLNQFQKFLNEFLSLIHLHFLWFRFQFRCWWLYCIRICWKSLTRKNNKTFSFKFNFQNPIKLFEMIFLSECLLAGSALIQITSFWLFTFSIQESDRKWNWNEKNKSQLKLFVLFIRLFLLLTCCYAGVVYSMLCSFCSAYNQNDGNPYDKEYVFTMKKWNFSIYRQ